MVFFSYRYTHIGICIEFVRSNNSFDLKYNLKNDNVIV